MTNIQELIASTPDGTSIDSNLSFHGTMVLNGPGAVRIGGTFEGSIVAKAGTVIVQETGIVRGTISAANVIVSGTVTTSNANAEADHIEATQCLALAKTATVASPMITYGSIAMDFGASIMGGMKPLTKADATDLTPPAPAPDKVLSIENLRPSSVAIPLRAHPMEATVVEAKTREASPAPAHSVRQEEDLDQTLTPLVG